MANARSVIWLDGAGVGEERPGPGTSSFGGVSRHSRNARCSSTDAYATNRSSG